MHPQRQEIWEGIWKCTVEKNPINATSVTLHSLQDPIWEGIWKYTVVKSLINAASATAFSASEALGRHLKTHNRDFMCKRYDYVTISALNLKTHFLTHKGDKSNKCNQCNYASSQAGNLRIHLMRHCGEKSSKCEQCDFASFDASSLRRHLKIHSGKISKCNLCEYASKKASYLRAHLKRHNREKLNKCNQWLCILYCRPIEDTYDNTQWHKAIQMRPVCLCILIFRQFEVSF